MFDTLTDRLNAVFRKLRSRGKLHPKQVDAALADIRTALLEADAALDVVQDAMLKLTEKYSGKPINELPMLFQRILQNTIHDFFRRQKVRSTWTTLLSSLGARDDGDEEHDPLETLPAKSESNATANPADPSWPIASRPRAASSPTAPIPNGRIC